MTHGRRPRLHTPAAPDCIRAATAKRPADRAAGGSVAARTPARGDSEAARGKLDEEKRLSARGLPSAFFAFFIIAMKEVTLAEDTLRSGLHTKRRTANRS